MRRPSRRPATRRRSEHQEQAELVGRVQVFYPDALLFAVPNGGLRNVKVAAHLKAEGVKRGAPDLILAEPRGPYCAMAIEMKAIGGRLSQDQKDFLERLEARRWFTHVAFGVEDAFKAVEAYLALPPPVRPPGSKPVFWFSDGTDPL